jgi:hypothetical protein
MLLASSDLNALFITVHATDFGKRSDSSVFKATTLREIMEKEELHIQFSTG